MRTKIEAQFIDDDLPEYTLRVWSGIEGCILLKIESPSTCISDTFTLRMSSAEELIDVLRALIMVAGD